MSKSNKTRVNMRVIHRYLGFFLAGIMFMYALSGITLIFRDTEFLKQKKQIEKTIEPNISMDDLGKILKKRDFKIDNVEGDIVFFKDGFYNKNSGLVKYEVNELPFIIDKMTKIHKAKTSDALYFLNIFFGLSLLFFVVSSFWMFIPKTAVFKKGIYFSIAGIVLTLLLLLL
jgi:hypothetical protein